MNKLNFVSSLGSCTGLLSIITLDLNQLGAIIMAVATIVCAISTIVGWCVRIFDALRKYAKGEKTADETAEKLTEIADDIEKETKQ